jgi:F-type H+-transporting ATPase subunit b
MEIFQQIGINGTFIYQFLIFAVVIIFLSKFVFTGYAHSFEERENRTKGGEDLAVEFKKKTIQLQEEYEKRAREIATEIKWIFDTHKQEATRAFEDSTHEARTTADAIIKSNRTTLGAAVSVASDELKKQTASVAQAITNKLLGK